MCSFLQIARGGFDPCVVQGTFEPLEPVLRACQVRRTGNRRQIAVTYFDQIGSGAIGAFDIVNGNAVAVPVAWQAVDADYGSTSLAVEFGLFGQIAEAGRNDDQPRRKLGSKSVQMF